MPRSSFRSIAAFIVMACQMASTWSSVSGRRVGYCERVLSRFSELSENSMLNVKGVSKCFWENEGIYSNLNKFDYSSLERTCRSRQVRRRLAAGGSPIRTIGTA